MRPTGSITALATPFTASCAIDFPAWERLLQAQLEGGTDALVVAGSTGEAAALEDDEQDALLSRAVAFIAGRIPVIAGTGQSGTVKTVARTRRAAALGADAALVVTPPYVRPTQAGLVAHYLAVADAGELPVLLYNVPGRTGCDLLPETVATLARHPRIIGLKEARNEPERMQALLPLRNETFCLLSGDDPTFVRAMLAGADGVVSVASNVVPAAFAALVALAASGDADNARRLDGRLHPLYDFLAVESNPIPLKALLALTGIGDGPRLPLTPLSAVHATLARQMATEVAAIEDSVRDVADA
ncbi:MAG: 4-hydroxy-tetrahydrodipicolinate synthase [Pseudoxanthomonas suwonensis]|nr:4-hydroxy-tetrahydrodipicolinate synthase [Pseudoxanthomonas suwonensis]